jgi:soluble lytic murein transglycosylase-like protein
MIRFCTVVLCLAAAALPASAGVAAAHGDLDALIASYANANGVPEALVHRVIVRESRYNARAIGRGGAMGLMQIKHATARGLGYTGSASGLLDPETNLNYAVRYLAGAYRAAGGNTDRAVSYYARGYYYAAKRKGARVEALAQPGGSRDPAE